MSSSTGKMTGLSLTFPTNPNLAVEANQNYDKKIKLLENLFWWRFWVIWAHNTCIRKIFDALIYFADVGGADFLNFKRLPLKMLGESAHKTDKKFEVEILLEMLNIMFWQDCQYCSKSCRKGQLHSFLPSWRHDKV